MNEALPDGFQMTELGPLPKEWRVVRLGEVAEKPQYGFTAAARRDPVGPKILRITDIQDGNVNWNTLPYCECGNDDIPKYLLEAGDILFARTGSVGKTFLVSSVPEPSIFASYLIRVRVDRTKLDPQFAFLFMQSAAYWSQIASQTHGAVQPNVNATQLRSLLLPLPPLPEQRAIAHVLRTVQRAKEATEGVIAALKELKKSLMQHLFTYGPVPVTECERVPLQETEIGPLPKEWRVVRLGEVLQLMRNGLTYRQERNHKGVPVTRIETISDGNINPNKVGYISSIDKRQIEKYRLLPGDILFSHINSEPHLGKTAIYQGNPPLILHGMNLLLLRVHPSVSDPYFLFYLLNHERAKGTFIGLAARAVGQSSINMGKLRNLSVPLPPLAEQREIARILQAVDAKIAAEQARRAALEELFKSLLHELMSGRIRLSDFPLEEKLDSQNRNA